MKKKRSWITLAVLSLVLAVTVIGCGTPKANDVGKTRTANNLEITVQEIELKDANQNDKQIAKIEFSVKNVGKEESGAGAGDFIIETRDGKKHQVYGMNENNFGDAIAAGKTLTGAGYYEIPANQKSFTIHYEPNTDVPMEASTWEITTTSK
ncbi:DUF4352 domain-containing protein [Listeria booriae]|uniref:DUF4352 domain-containing protein n=1 Tax=Listeria booriae TaxID=1552123 RepID=UPI00162A93B4|nr:DUF4352 domain-containing protein [Listeria booriae]MBC1273816.1 DUF4352 domain-containing protein [Listeria booriae]MBC1574063.1 DUF4352 domain-containing protein [Listeria booriae]